MRKIPLVLIGVVLVAGGVAAVSAFEAHVINVTAHIENALSVLTKEIDFGTVFPQEYLEKPFIVFLSDSFMAADRVDDVSYTIKQKPKCKAIEPGTEPVYKPVDYTTDLCPAGYKEMLSLCPFLSKTDADPDDNNDIGVPSYFDGKFLTCHEPSQDNATGKLSKIKQDTSDGWIVDLKVPPVKGTVGQDWPANCPTISADSQDWGCDLWIEVTGISEKPVLTEKELACINSGGSIETSTCCLAASDFPNACSIGACGCAPEASHEVKTCNCGPGKCFDGNSCVSACVPSTEVCDGVDNDCDGVIDEGCPAAGLFFSEYVEGTSSNKALEIYNPTGFSIDLTGYKIEAYHNGATTPTHTIPLSSVLTAGDVYVVCNSSFSEPTKSAVCDLLSGNISFNGDDAIVLKNSLNDIFDVIGQIGFDPGSEWGSGLTSTQDNTLVRMCGISHGDNNGSDVFNPSAEWSGFVTDDFSHLGSHGYLCN